MPVPLFATSLEPYLERITERLASVAASGRYILGPEVEQFEREFAAHCGAAHCVGVANGTDAITIALRALGVQRGDEVVLPSFTFYATAEATANAGAVPVFCDVDPDTFCVTPETVERALTPRTKAIVPVHLFGRLAPDLSDFGLPVLADAAQAAGAPGVARDSDAATFSFFPSKNLPCLGDGGAIVTDNDDAAQAARRLRFHGSTDKATFSEIGYNSRLDELQAAVLRVLLPELDGWNARRRAAAAAYRDGGLGDLVAIPDAAAEHVFHLYVVRHERSDALERLLSAAGIGARRYYRRPIHMQPAFRQDQLDLPGTLEAAATHLALPMGPTLTSAEIDQVIAACASGLT